MISLVYSTSNLLHLIYADLPSHFRLYYGHRRYFHYADVMLYQLVWPMESFPARFVLDVGFGTVNPDLLASNPTIYSHTLVAHIINQWRVYAHRQCSTPAERRDS
jgi:hypothetical protein